MIRLTDEFQPDLNCPKDVILVGETGDSWKSVVIDANLPHLMEFDENLNGVFPQLEPTRIRQINISVGRFRYQTSVEFR